MAFAKYLFSGLLLVALSGCGNSSTNALNNVEDPEPLPALAVSRLNDTGQTLYSDGFSLTASGTVGAPGHDAGTGRDALFAASLLTKTGSGAASFDFTKLDNAGLVLAADASAWDCVRDNHTGLVWEAANSGNHSSVLANVQTYVDTVNGQVLCGFNDWRLPELGELRSIVHFGTESPAIDPDFFPGTVANRYWAAEGPWFIHFHDGSSTDEESIGGNFVRLVRGGDPVPDERFIDHGDGTITDQLTNLMWKKCLEGRKWDAVAATCETDNDSVFYNWQPASVRPVSVNDGTSGENLGYGDWRLPNIKELTSLVEPERIGGPLDTTLFDVNPDSLPSTYPLLWSSTPTASLGSYVRVLLYVSGYDASQSTGTPARILLVRSNDGVVD